MSGDSRTAGTDPVTEHESGLPRLAQLVAGRSRDRLTGVRAAGGLALLTVAVHTTLHVFANLPFQPISVPEGIRGAIIVGVPVVLGIVLVVVALASVRPTVRIGLLFAGVFGLLATIDSAATLPAYVAVVAGSGLAVLGPLIGPTASGETQRSVLAGVFLLAIAVSLAGAVGVLTGGRGLGSLLVLTAIAGLGLRARNDRLALASGALAFVAVAVASAANPYAAGSALLVGFAVVGVPHLLVGLAVAGGTAAVVAGRRHDHSGLAVGAGLLLLAGMPATLPRALAVLLGVAFALVGGQQLTTPPESGEVTP